MKTQSMFDRFEGCGKKIRWLVMFAITIVLVITSHIQTNTYVSIKSTRIASKHRNKIHRFQPSNESQTKIFQIGLQMKLTFYF